MSTPNSPDSDEVRLPKEDAGSPAPAPAPEVPAPAPPPVAPGEGPLVSKVDKEKVLTFIEDIIDTLTFKRVALIALLTVIALGINALFENRLAIVQRLTASQPVEEAPVIAAWTLSEQSKTALQNLAKSTNVSYISISDVDLKKNRRTVKYFFIDDPAIKPTPEQLQALSLPQATFDYDQKNTQQMVAILSNEFRCDPYRDTIYFRYAPDLADQLPTICRIAIPPFVGQFVGILSVGMDKEMSRTELDTIRLEVSRIAVDIYLNDVIKQPATTR